MSYKLIKDHTFVNYSVGNTDRLYIVIHYTGNTTDTASANANYFRSCNRGASAHYFVDETSVYEVVSPNDSAWAVGVNYGSNNLFGRCTNFNSISIEMCSTNSKIAQATFNNTVELTKTLMKKYNIPASRVIRHYDVCSKICPGWKGWTGSDESIWKKFKSLLVEKKVKIKKKTSAYKYGYKDPISNTSIPVITLAKGTAVDWIYDDGTGWSKIKYKGKEYFVPNTRLDKNGLSKYSTITLPSGKKVYRIKNGKLCKATTLIKKRKFTVICSISAGKYKGYKVLNRNSKEYYYK